jgi:hypothetical protein
MSKRGRQMLEPGFLARKYTNHLNRINKKNKANDKRFEAMGLKHKPTSYHGSIHSIPSNGKRKRIRAEMDDADYSPPFGEDDSDDGSIGSFEEEDCDLRQQAPSRSQREANQSSLNQDVVTQIPPPLDPESQIEAPPVVASVALKKSKKGRGVARGFDVKRRLKTGGKIKGVIFDEDKWLPVGPAEKVFKMELGIITRLLAPLNVFYWKRMTVAQKAPLFERLESEFEVKFEDQHTRTVVDSIMAMRFRQFKHRCHLHYKKFSTEEAPQHPPTDVEPVDWIRLCEHFETEGFKKKSDAGVKNRKDLEVNHTSGSKSFIQRLYEMENLAKNSEENSETREEPSQLKLYKDTHLKKDGNWVHARARENHEKMDMLKNQPVQDGNKLTEDEIREKILKTKTGYSRGLGYGVKPPKGTSLGASARIQAQRVEEADKRAEEADKRAKEADKRAEEAERRAQQFQEEIQDQRSTITKLQESQLDLQHAFKTFMAQFDGRIP